MSGVHPLPNTTEDLPCVNCGSPGNVIREANVPEAKKLKCRNCAFMYTAKASLDAKAAGAIPDAPPVIDHAQGADIKPEFDSRELGGILQLPDEGPIRARTKIVRTPTYVLISKDRLESEFANGKSLNKTVLRWEYEEKKFDLFELSPKKVSTKVELQ